MQALLIPQDVFLEDDFDDDMKLRKEDQEWLTAEISRVVKEANDTLLDSLNPRPGLRRVMNWLREWGAISAIWAVPLALLAMVITLGIFAGSGISKNATFQAATEGRLTAIEKGLVEINKQLAQQSITNHAALPLEDFKATLPNLSTALATARKDNLVVPNTVINQLHTKLNLTDSNIPGFWPTAASLISIRSSQSQASFSRSSHFPDAFSGENFPDCADTTPEPTKIAKVDSPTQAEMQWSRYTDCVLTLDSTRDTDQVNAMMDTSIRVVFKHCIIVYRGGPIGLKLQWNGEKRDAFMGDKNNPQPLGKIVLTGQTVEFEDSTFEFTIPAAPPKSGQVAMKMLLAQSGKTLVLPDPRFRITNPVDSN
jgi:hypothetical protein